LDKIMTCSHCGYELDVLDEVTIEGDGVTIHRKDLGGDQAMAAMSDMEDLMPNLGSMVGADIAAQVREQLSKGEASGKKISHTVTTTTTHHASGAEAEKILADMGLDMGAIVSQSLKQAHVEAQQPPPESKSRGKSMLAAFMVMLILAGAGAAIYYFQ
jgi:hypothetical protein